MDIWQHYCDSMITTIRAEMHHTCGHTGIGQLSPRVEQAMRRVPRHRFVPAWNRHMAYADMPLSIGHGQTISQPFIVALMTELLSPGPSSTVLEIGTGCGYQTAILASLVAQVCSLEVVPDLAEQARIRLAKLDYGNIDVRQGDGHQGWPEARQFDAIMVTAAARDVPPAPLAQLREGGRMVIPVGQAGCTQQLLLIERHGDIFRQRPVLPVVFVPLVEKN